MSGGDRRPFRLLQSHLVYRRRTAAVAKQPKGDLFPVVVGFNYRAIASQYIKTHLCSLTKENVHEIVVVPGRLLALTSHADLLLGRGPLE
jgi:hypothetical protein